MDLQKVKIIDRAASTDEPDGKFEFTIDGHPIRITSYSVQRKHDGLCLVTFTVEAGSLVLEHELGE